MMPYVEATLVVTLTLRDRICQFPPQQKACVVFPHGLREGESLATLICLVVRSRRAP
jgi:hypothetical protein